MILIGSVTVLAGVAIFVGAFLVRALGGAASSILADEFTASAPETAQKIIRLAARRVPEHSREEVLETWLAEASEYEGRPLKALRFALVNCLAAAPGLARQLRPALAPASEAVKEGGGRKERGGVRRGSDLIRREARVIKDFLRFTERPWRDTLKAVAGSPAAFGGLLLSQIRESARVFGEILAGFSSATFALMREILELLGPYDYSHEWRSVLQLLVKTIAMVLTVSLGAAALFYISEVIFGL